LIKHQTNPKEYQVMQPFLAMIVPVGAGEPTHPIAPGGPPPGIWPSPGHPAHPIAPGGAPPGFWGGVAPPYPDQGLPGAPPGIWPSPGYPAHPIAPGGPPPGIWGDINLPAHPIVLPPGTEKPPPGIWHDIVFPSHPIAPGGSPPPLGFWGGVPPLQIWGDPILPAEKPKIIDWYAGWSERTGWVLVGIPNVPAPTPSAAKP
jgi:hypothetical protein